MDNNPQNTIPTSQIDFLYNGLVSLYPEYIYEDFAAEQIPSKKEVYFGLNAEKFKNTLLASLKTFGVTTFKDAVKMVKELKIKTDKGEQIYGTLPINLDELVEFAQETKKPDEGTVAYQEILKQAKRRAEINKKYIPVKKTEIKDVAETKTKAEDIYFNSKESERQIRLDKKQQQIVKLAHKDPKRFADEITKRSIASNPKAFEDPAFIDSANVVAFDFTKKLLSLDPKDPVVVIDNSPFEVLTFFANPNNEDLVNIIPDQDSRQTISTLAQNAAYALEKDTTFATNLIESALGPGWSPFYIPDKIRAVEASTVPIDGSSGTANMKAFLGRMSNFMASEKRIWDSIKKENPDLILNLTKQERAKLDKEVKEAAKKVVSISSAFSFITSRRAYLPAVEIPSAKHETGWLQAQWGAMGIPNFSQGSLAFMPSSVGGTQSSSMLLSPAMNVAFDKFITRIPAVAKLKAITAGLGTKVTAKIAAKAAGTKLGVALAANLTLPPIIGQIVSVLFTLLSLKDIATTLKKWFNEHPEALAVFVGAPLIILGWATGVPFFAYTGFFGGLTAWALRRGLRKTLTRGPAYYFKRFLKFMLESIVGGILVALAIYVGSVLIISFILYIINSGAYIYPPSSGSAITATLTGEVESPYIKVTKVPDQPGPFENNDLPLTIEYTVTIIAKKGVLTNIQISDSCSATKESGTIDCPKEEPTIPSGTQIGEISPSTPYTFSYKRTYASPDFEDALVVDTISVRAEVDTGVMANDSASVIIKIGNPPENCPSIWPVTGTYGVTQGPGGGYSHSSIEAIDIGTPTGTNVIATHNGVARVVTTTGAYRPAYIDIISTCGGVSFFSRYAHLSALAVTTGETVVVGQIIGSSGYDGNGPHLHYEFRGLKMAPPYIPKTIPYGCNSVPECGYIP